MKLNHQPCGFQGLISHIDGDVHFKKKLMSLGLRQGQRISVLHRHQGGIVVLSNGSRVALGAKVAAKISLQPLAGPSGTNQRDLAGS